MLLTVPPAGGVTAVTTCLVTLLHLLVNSILVHVRLVLIEENCHYHLLQIGIVTLTYSYCAHNAYFLHLPGGTERLPRPDDVL